MKKILERELSLSFNWNILINSVRFFNFSRKTTRRNSINFTIFWHNQRTELFFVFFNEIRNDCYGIYYIFSFVYCFRSIIINLIFSLTPPIPFWVMQKNNTNGNRNFDIHTISEREWKHLQNNTLCTAKKFFNLHF